MIGRFLYGPVHQALANTNKMDYRMEEMRTITRRIQGLKDRMVLFRWIPDPISLNVQNEVSVVGGLGVVL